MKIKYYFEEKSTDCGNLIHNKQINDNPSNNSGNYDKN